MKRSTRFLIGLVAAMITYGSLIALVGPRHWGFHRGYSYWSYNHGRHYDCDGINRGQWRNRPEAPQKRATPDTENNSPTPQ